MLNSLYLFALGGLPTILGLSWWAWLRSPRSSAPQWRSILYFTGLCAATVNFILYWAFVVWLQFHYTDQAYKVRDPVANLGLILLLYSLAAVSIGKGPYRFFAGVACVLAMIPWVPLGV